MRSKHSRKAAVVAISAPMQGNLALRPVRRETRNVTGRWSLERRSAFRAPATNKPQNHCDASGIAMFVHILSILLAIAIPRSPHLPSVAMGCQKSAQRSKSSSKVCARTSLTESCFS